MSGEHVEKCNGCGEMIDSDVCWCGQLIDHGYDNHTAIPMGCNCYRNSEKDIELRASYDTFSNSVFKQ